MAVLNDTAAEWQAGIYQLETTDPVVGGVPNEETGAGMDNIPHLQLARRTSWLRTQVLALQGLVVAASTSVAGIVRLTNGLTSTSATTALTAAQGKVLQDAKAEKSTTISAGGLATGGGTLESNRTITVPEATQGEAEAGTSGTKVMTPRRVAQYITALFACSITGNGYITLPGGLIIQWLIASVQSGDTSVTMSLPITYPSNHRGAVATRLSDLMPSTSDVCAVGVSSQSSVTLRRAAAPTTIASYFVLSIGW